MYAGEPSLRLIMNAMFNVL